MQLIIARPNTKIKIHLRSLLLRYPTQRDQDSPTQPIIAIPKMERRHICAAYFCDTQHKNQAMIHFAAYYCNTQYREIKVHLHSQLLRCSTQRDQDLPTQSVIAIPIMEWSRHTYTAYYCDAQNRENKTHLRSLLLRLPTQRDTQNEEINTYLGSL